MEFLSETSMAALHVAGFAAYLLGTDNTITSNDVNLIIHNGAPVSVLTGVCGFFLLMSCSSLPWTLNLVLLVANGTVDKLLHSGL